ncbi:tRNA (adenosine(37)-N6)-dimethylallyltransferase MiaA [Paenibacillaceae bacterium]|nr:tRNA (adenosine(37)-N6)-dimethylallyltransferase MiaA [Paenibacillaceae bacterium]
MSSAERSEKQKLLVLLGPTAVGKTAYSLGIAKAWNAEIISGDSMQVYKGMDIGTAKLAPDEREGIPHHLIDLCEPSHPFSVSEFQERVRGLIDEIAGRGKLPFIVGGTGLYIESVCYDYQFSDIGADNDYRDRLQQLADTEGNEAVHALLRDVDPDSAQRLHPNDLRRIIRALEIFHLTGTTLSSQLARQTRTSPYELCLVGLTMDRQALYERLEQRIDAMMSQGLVTEVQRLLGSGIPRSSTAMQGLGYKEIVSYLEGECSLEEAIYRLKRDTRHFAKRQLSWFRHMKEIQWVDLEKTENFHENLAAIHGIIAGKFQVDLEYTSN